jgi:hypothetical protein
MKSKLDKLNELGELVKSGTLTQDEFNKLKTELLTRKVTKTESNQVKKELKKKSISTHNKKTPGIDKLLTEKEKRKLNMGSRKKNKSGRGIGFYALWGLGIFLFFVIKSVVSFDFDKDINGNPINTSVNNSSKSKTDEWTPPYGYKKGGTCRDCSGTGKYLYDGPFGVVKEGAICAGCNGRGYLVVKK